MSPLSMLVEQTNRISTIVDKEGEQLPIGVEQTNRISTIVDGSEYAELREKSNRQTEFLLL